MAVTYMLLCTCSRLTFFVPPKLSPACATLHDIRLHGPHSLKQLLTLLMIMFMQKQLECFLTTPDLMLILLQPICYPVVQLLFAEEELTQWQWYRSASHKASTAAATPLEGIDNTGDGKAAHHAGFEAMPGAVKRLYVPTQDDENHTLRVQCKPVSRWVSFAACCTMLQTSMLLVALSSSMHTITY